MKPSFLLILSENVRERNLCHSSQVVLQVALDSRRQDVETDDIGNCDEYHEAVDEIDDLLYIKYRPGDHCHAEKYTIGVHRQA